MERTLCGVTTVSMVMFLAMAVALAVLGYHYQENLGGGFSSGEPRSIESLVSLASRCLPTCRATRINSVGGIGSDDWTFRVVVVGDWVTDGLSAESAASV
ncbi:hypothetical protein IscW_ISCW008624 [Ixodes scapularis]|uniref:Uncharacterized protein n=1 Tax=Ixodes scapularis TaxID=6945 RepID=B7PY17_IXOSC|nr:hypothetical protein IscW_ISCW008624 [Ixodes scapularis]|eukprot:XP_002402317.1 hypothetical protein IscW_ISCW008624 [Ixodes scapularis]